MAPKKATGKAAGKNAKSSFMTNTIFVDVAGKSNVTKKNVKVNKGNKNNG